MLGKTLLALSTTVLFLGPLQERVKPKGPADFGKTIESAKANWEKGSFGACVKDLQTLTGLAMEKRALAIREALPAAPEGWEKVPAEPMDTENPFLAAMGGGLGNIVEQEYRSAESRRAGMQATVTADSPLVSMLSMMFGNPAMAGENVELVKYGSHKALLTKESDSLQLQILISDAHVVDVSFYDTDEDKLFGMWDQAAVDRLASALAQ